MSNVGIGDASGASASWHIVVGDGEDVQFRVRDERA